MARVQLEQLTKIYPGGVRAVNSIDLDIADRELVVLVGPSGCGKTTTLRMIAGLEEVTRGTIRINGKVVNDLPPKDRDLAMVFQNYALYPHMSVYNNLAFGLKMRGTARAEIDRRVMDTARTLDIGHLLRRKPRALSGGQRQRVAVGRAIVREPAAFLFDEPLSNLDARLRVTTRAELKRMHQRLRTTTLYVTHDQEEAMTLGDRIVVIQEGVIQQADSPLQTYNYPVNRFVAGFIGMPPMNFFDGSTILSDGRLVFVEGNVPAGGDSAAGGGGFRVPVPERIVAMLNARAGRPVTMGIRPEHMSLRPVGDGQGLSIEMKVNVVEPLGSDMDVYMSTSLNDHVVARVEADFGLQADARVTMYVDPRKVHFFEPGETGMNLSLKNEPSHAVA